MDPSHQPPRQIADFECSQCGHCCRGLSDSRGILLFPSDVQRLSQNLGLTPEDFRASYCSPTLVQTANGQLAVSRLRSRRGECPFLSGSRCSVHAFKPAQCARTPFHFFWGFIPAYDCIKDVVVPGGWSTRSGDLELVREVVFEQLKGGADVD